MSDLERRPPQPLDLVRELSLEGQRLLRRKRRRMKRIIKGLLLMGLAPFVIIPTMIAAGLLFGPRGVEGLITAPLALFAVWGALAYWTFFRKIAPEPAPSANVALLPSTAEDWLEEQRALLPRDAQVHVESIARQLAALAPQLQGVDAQAPGANELRRLLAEELPELVRGYRKLPAEIAQKPLYGGATPERRLVEGLETIDKELARVSERLAADHLHSLATHQRYLQLKYKDKDDVE